MRYRATIASLAVATASLVGAGWGAAPAGGAPGPAGKTCTWGGTPAAPTGTFSMEPGLTNLPAPWPLEFKATGVLAGDEECEGTMTWVGHIPAGSTCLYARFEGVVKGLPGVAHFWGQGNLLAPSQLYDRDGNLVGEENANIITEATLTAGTAGCNSPEGFTGGDPATFSSVVQLFTDG